MKLVYIVSPYAGDIEENIRKARAYCRYACECGYIPIAVHLLFPTFLQEDVPEEREKGIQMGVKLIERCDAVWVFGNTISKGMRREIDAAEQIGVPITYIDWEVEKCIFIQTI